MLWKKTDVKFCWFNGSQSEISSVFVKNLCSSVTHLKFIFNYCHWKKRLNFEKLCLQLKGKCPHLHTLILHRALFSVSLSSVIDLCNEFLPNLKVLILLKSVFDNECKERAFGGFPKLEVLDISECSNIGRSYKYVFTKMPYLKKINLFGTYETEYRWFWHDDNVSFLRQLELLHLGNTSICSRTFHILQNYAINLTELFLCWTELDDDAFVFNNSVFPLLKTVCLRRCRNLNCESIVSLVQSCELLQDVYIDLDMAESYTKHAVFVGDIAKLGIVKPIDNCHHSKIQDYLMV